MKKETKTITIIVLAVVIILALIWGLYATFKTEESAVNPANNLSDESMGLSDTANSINENAITNSEAQNEVANETTDETGNEVVDEEVTEPEATESNTGSESEIVTGTTASREDRAEELAKEYYEKEYGSADEIYFTYQSVNSDGRYIIRAGNADSGTNMFLYVNIDTGKVSEN